MHIASQSLSHIASDHRRVSSLSLLSISFSNPSSFPSLTAMRPLTLLAFLAVPLLTLAQDESGGSSNNAQVSTILSTSVGLDSDRQTQTQTITSLVTLTGSAADSTPTNSNSSSNSSNSGNSTSSSNSTSNSTSSSSSSSALPTATQSVDGGGTGSGGAPSPGASSDSGIYGPDDSYVSAALDLSATTFVSIADKSPPPPPPPYYIPSLSFNSCSEILHSPSRIGVSPQTYDAPVFYSRSIGILYRKFLIPVTVLGRRSSGCLIFCLFEENELEVVRSAQTFHLASSGTMALDDLIMTIDSDVEEVTKEPQKSAKAKGGKAKESNKTVFVDDSAPDEKDTLNPEFAFDLTGDVYDEALNEDDGLGDLVKGSKREPVSVEDIIARRKLSNAAKKRKRDVDVEETGEEEEDDEDEDICSEEDLSGSEAEDKDLIHNEAEESEDSLATTDEEGDDSDEVLEGGTGDEKVQSEDESSEPESEEETQAEKERKAAFFASPDDPSTSEKTTHTTFTTMSLSRPLLKALTTLGFTTPTPIQAATIPVALLGKDVVGNAVTGSGKTAAFMIPVLERLMYRERGKNKAAVRCVVLVPTRELGVQCTDVARKLAAYMDVRISLIVGGLSLKAQEAELRTRPDILVATPGRLIDHLRNSPSFGLETLDVLILDEADRMLSEGFADELKEIIQACPTSRQTMLFSATMTDDVDELVRMSLSRPVKLFVDPKRSTARGLIQEFVRVRSGKESERPALFVALCKRAFKQGVLVFFSSKKLAHQMRVVFGILGMKAEELHGDLSQRLRALQLFRDGSVDYLMATDLASRGLDIKGIETVVNYDMPGQLAQYLHRVGRTARAGKKGRSVTLVGEADRKILKAAIKHASDADKVRHRTIPTDQLALWSKRLVEIKGEITEVLREEKEEKALRQAERDLKKGENLIEHEKEIFSRPARTWFQTEKEKLAAKETSKKQYELASGVAVPSKEKAKEVVDTKGPKRDKFAGLSRRAKRRKLALQEDASETAAVRAAVRNAKKSSRPTKIGLPEFRKQKPGKAKNSEKKKRKLGRVTAKQGVFEREIGEKRKSHTEMESSMEQSMETDRATISSLATVRLQAKSRLFLTACCPDKDLVVLISRVVSGDKMSLWKMQGAKKWEVDLSKGNGAPDEVTAVNWSPDGQIIVVAHYPPRLSLHSLQNGREEFSLLIQYPSGSPSPYPRITGVWWFKRERKSDSKQLPDMFRRGNVVPGSALSVIRTQPLLFPLQDDTVPLNASDLFAFQAGQARRGAKTSALPDVISSWPTLPSDPLAAGISVSPRENNNRPGDELNEKDSTNVDSLLVAADSSGQIYCFLDGSYPLGAISLGSGCEAKTIMKDNEADTLLVHAEFRPQDTHNLVLNNVFPLVIQVPLLNAKSTRLIAENCSAARELAWYTVRVVKEMKRAWFGGDGHAGARDFNANYIRGLQERQARFDQKTDAIFDLTVLLATGKSSPALSDYNQTGELTSERGFQKWETTVGEALLELRDYSETRVAPACQRLHLLLEEVRGWSLLPELYGKYEFFTEEVDECLALAGRAIVLAAWLAATARQELNRFAEFQGFLRYETNRLNAADAIPIPRHDIMEVNEYLMSGLVVSSIDKWFVGPAPQFSLDSIAPAAPTMNLRSSIDRAREFAADPVNLTWPPITQKKDLSRLDRNLDVLVHALAEKCQKIYDRAAKAVAKTFFVDRTWGVPAQIQQVDRILDTRVAHSSASQLTRSRAVYEEKTRTLTEHLAIRLQKEEHELSQCRELLCIIRASHWHDKSSNHRHSVAFAILECKSRSGRCDGEDELEDEDFHIFDMAFFDEQSLVIVYQSYAEEGAERIGTIDYSGLEYLEVELERYVNGVWQEDIVAEAITKLSAGQVSCPAVPVRKQRALKLTVDRRKEMTMRRDGQGALAVNGRAGRRVACVVDGKGNELEMLDMEGEEEAAEEDEYYCCYCVALLPLVPVPVPVPVLVLVLVLVPFSSTTSSSLLAAALFLHAPCGRLSSLSSQVPFSCPCGSSSSISFPVSPMPKTPNSQPSPSSKLPANAPGADKVDKMSEIALRKKKNADAQAAFRARRANYIATLEETVTSLEAVVVQLQDSCREARGEASELRQENQRLVTALETLRHECRERDKYLRALWHSRKTSDDPHLDDFPAPPPSFNAFTPATNPGAASSSLGTPVTTPLPNPVTYSTPSADGLDPRVQQYTQDASVAALHQTPYHDASSNAYGERSPAMQFMTHEGDANGRTSANAIGMAKINQYAFSGMAGHVRGNAWHTGVTHAGPSGAETVTAGENGSSSHSPAFIPSPTITSAEPAYGCRYPQTVMDTHKNTVPGMDHVSYVLNNNDRSISPTISSPHNGSSSSSVNSQFQFVFPTDGQDRSDTDYHRRMTAPTPEITLHGGTADVSAYAINRRRAATGPERPMLGGPMPVLPVGDGSKVGVNAGTTGVDSRGVRRRRNTSQSNGGEHSSRSPSPCGHPPISSTLAVIKAQAFGALRRTRARPKKTSEGAAKMAMEVLEARGIGLGINSQAANKRPRLSDDGTTGPVL
ncbi:hypothetical protein ACEPAF_3661 [Sanghuangporus sanghuang]